MDSKTQAFKKKFPLPPADAAPRIAIEQVEPQIDCGLFAAKATQGHDIEIAADIFADGTTVVRAQILYKAAGVETWTRAPMRFVDNDRWGGIIPADTVGSLTFTIEAWFDGFATWGRDFEKKRKAGVDLPVDLTEGRQLIEAAIDRAEGNDRAELLSLLSAKDPIPEMLDPAAAELMARCQEKRHLSRFPRELPIWVDRKAALFSAWYELFPRSQSDEHGQHGTLDDVIRRLPYVQELGFDVLYFPPIHPIGKTHRKGKNNTKTAEAGDPGSVYAIGAAEGGHTEIHPALGTLADFRRLVAEARGHGLEIALDFAIQCSPDHPWLKQHRDWFAWRPDGSLRYAENPPKKYEDIVNVEFYGQAYPEIWQALRNIVLFWIEQGVKIFRVDNPHTKPFPFWEWMIQTVHAVHPDVIFLSEAFTRPKVMKHLGKLGFTQSYTYFTWRETKQELTEYLTELATAPAKYMLRPNFFANTPDINPKHLQTGGRAAFLARATLAATLSSSYGIYNGFELCEATAIPNSEEYLDSEKYELRQWDYERPGNIRDHIKALNRIRRENPALQQLAGLQFYNAFNDHILYYGKATRLKDNVVLIAVNLDPHAAQECDFEIPLWEFGLTDSEDIEAVDLLSGHAFTWHGKIQHMRLDPSAPYAIWRLNPKMAEPPQ